jgi:chromosome segregation ATPase
MLEKKKEDVKAALHAIKESRKKGQNLGNMARKVIHDHEGDPDVIEVHNITSEPDYNVDKLNADIDSEKARLELTQGGSPHLIKEFEEREKQIKKLRDKQADFQTKLADYQSSIDEVRSHWEPKLDLLIAKISDAFSDSFQRIGCAGQVSLDKVEEEPGPNGEPGGSDFEKWSIQIHVKFREHESLSLLDSHRQSGGERAVSTIFYLMALQSLSASPFRVVDEINQGMDPRNERMVHGRLVDIACASSEAEETDDDGNSVGGGGGGQYFLITPKLLSGLVYKPGMKVLCIYSGEHMPQDYAKLDFGLAIRTMKRVRAKNGNNGKGKGRAIEGSNSVGVYA